MGETRLIIPPQLDQILLVEVEQKYTIYEDKVRDRFRYALQHYIRDDVLKVNCTGLSKAGFASIAHEFETTFYLKKFQPPRKRTGDDPPTNRHSSSSTTYVYRSGLGRPYATPIHVEPEESEEEVLAEDFDIESEAGSKYEKQESDDRWIHYRLIPLKQLESKDLSNITIPSKDLFVYKGLMVYIVVLFLFGCLQSILAAVYLNHIYETILVIVFNLCACLIGFFYLERLAVRWMTKLRRI